jgi:hypothetical protein
MKREWQLALFAASAATMTAVMTDGSLAQDADGVRCRPNVVYRAGSYCDIAARSANWNGQSAAGSVESAPAANTNYFRDDYTAYRDTYTTYRGDYAAGVYRPGWFGGSYNRYVTAPVDAPAYAGADASGANAAGVVRPAAGIYGQNYSTAYAGDFAGGVYRPNGGYASTYGTYPAGPVYRQSYAAAYAGDTAAAAYNQGDAYPTRAIYWGTYVPVSYYGPVCDPRVDVLCQ